MQIKVSCQRLCTFFLSLSSDFGGSAPLKLLAVVALAQTRRRLLVKPGMAVLRLVSGQGLLQD